MLFDNPWMLLGLGGAAIPVVIHLINRRRAPVRPFAAIDFILLTNKRLMRRMKLRHWLVLAVRVLLISAIPLALARPYSVPDAARGGADGTPESTVIVVDDSLSMGARLGDETLFARAVTRADEVIQRLGSESNVAVVLAGSPPRALLPELSGDRERLRELLARAGEAGASEAATDAAGALRMAEAMLAASALPERRILVLTDLQATSWGEVTRPWALETPPAVEVVDVGAVDGAPGGPRVNAGITDVIVERALDVSPKHLRVSVEVAAFGAPFDDVVTARVAGRAMKASLRVPAGDRAKAVFLLKLESTEPVGGEATLPGDALPADDVRRFTVDFLQSVSVLIVNGAPRSIPYKDEVYFLERALRAAAEDQARLSFVTMRTDEVTPQQLGQVDVVVLANVLELRPDALTALRQAVRGGAGLLITAGDNATTVWNERLGELLPLPVRDVKPVVKRGEDGADVKALAVDTVDLEHPAMRLFRNLPSASLYTARFYTYLLLDGAGDARVVARYTNGAPLLVERQIGAGRTMLLTTTIDRDWSDLAIRSSFLPLVQQLVLHLAGRLDRPMRPSALVGEAWPIELEATLERLVVEGPDGQTTEIDDPLKDGKGPLSFEATGRAGVYTVRKWLEGGAARTERFAVNPDPREMDPAPTAAADLLGRLAPGEASGPGVAALATTSPWRTNLWPYVLAALFALLASEALLVVRR